MLYWLTYWLRQTAIIYPNTIIIWSSKLLALIAIKTNNNEVVNCNKDSEPNKPNFLKYKNSTNFVQVPKTSKLSKI